VVWYKFTGVSEEHSASILRAVFRHANKQSDPPILKMGAIHFSEMPYF
jgi:hypothetical protein